MTIAAAAPPIPASTVICHHCHCKSTLHQFFHKTLEGMLCPACAGRRALRQYQIFYGLAVLFILAHIFGVWYWTGQPGQLGLLLLSILCISIVLLILHELSHGGAAQLLGGRVFGIHLGVGTLILQRWLGNFYLGVSLIPASGICYSGFAQKPWLRLRYGLMVLAGPLFHVLLLLVLLLSSRASLGIPSFEWLRTTFLLNAFLLAVNLWPFLKVHTAMGVGSGDGKQIFDLLRGKITAAQIHQSYYHMAAAFALQQRRNDQALVELTQGLALYPDNQILHNLHGYLLIRNDQLAASLPIWQALVEAPAATAATGVTPEGQPLLQAIHYNNYAWVRLMRQTEPEDLTIAATYSERAFAMAPWLLPIRGTLAAVKVASGDYATGTAMALAVAEEYKRERTPNSRENCGATLATAALGTHRQGNQQAAHHLLAQAKTLAPQDIAVRQATAAIEDTPISTNRTT